MKILIVNTFYYPNEMGGAESSCRVLAESLAREGNEVVVVSTTNRPSYQDEKNGVKLIYINLFNIFWHGMPGRKGMLKGIIWHILDMFNPVMGYRFYNVIKQLKPDVVHTNNIVGFSCAVWLACRLRNVPVVHTLRDFYLKCFRSNMRKRGHNCEAQCIACQCLTLPRKYLSRSVATCVGNSQYMLDSHLGDGYFRSSVKTQVIYNAWAPDYDIESHHQQKLNCFSARRFGFIGRIAEEKGVELLCEAFLELLAGNEWSEEGVPELYIAGDGDVYYLDTLKNRFSHGRIHFVGKVKPEDFYSRIDYLVVPSLWEEPLARVVFEAFFFSVPVITTRKGGNPEIVIEGLNGFISDPDLPSLTSTLNMAMSVDYRKLVFSAYRSRVSHEPKNLLLKYSDVYK